MRRLALAAAFGSLALTACSHPEDRRWKLRTELPAELAEDEQPTVQVYSIPTAAPAGKTKITELSDRGQQALIEALAATGAKASELRALVASPLSPQKSDPGLLDRTQLDRTLIISVAKGLAAQPGDRLMRTVVTIKPHRDGPQDAAPFEFAGYTIAATDNKVQNIAHLETKTDASLTASVSPTISGTGSNSIGASLSRSHTTSADIAQQYENLNVDIRPDRLVVTRESERGLDVVGNTIVALTLATPPRTDRPTAFLASSTKLFEKGKALSPRDAVLSVRPLAYLPACPLKVDVTLRYQLRHIATGREYYTEGKQAVAIVSNTVRPEPQILVRASEVQGTYYQIVFYVRGHETGSLIASTVDGGQRPLLFDDFSEATAFATWMRGRRDTIIGTDGNRIGWGDAHIPPGATYAADIYELPCSEGNSR